MQEAENAGRCFMAWGTRVPILLGSPCPTLECTSEVFLRNEELGHLSLTATPGPPCL